MSQESRWLEKDAVLRAEDATEIEKRRMADFRKISNSKAEKEKQADAVAAQERVDVLKSHGFAAIPKGQGLFGQKRRETLSQPSNGAIPSISSRTRDTEALADLRRFLRPELLKCISDEITAVQRSRHRAGKGKKKVFTVSDEDVLDFCLLRWLIIIEKKTIAEAFSEE
jgi:hypothetical protein